MILWGWKIEALDTGKSKRCSCTQCVQEQEFEIILNYKFGHLFFVFGWLKEKSYILRCKFCGSCIEAKECELEDGVGEESIPFMKKHGWIFIFVYLVGILLLLISGEF